MPINIDMFLLDRKNKETLIYGLYFKCPVTQGNPVGCQLSDFRKLPFLEFKDMVQKMTDAEIEIFFLKHDNCKHLRIDV